MAVNEVGGNAEIPKKPEYKSPDEINLQPSDVYDSAKIGNALAGIENSVERDIAAALANDGKVDKAEEAGLAKWLNKAKNIADSISRIASDTYRGYYARFEAVIKNLEQYVTTEKAGSVAEPQGIDAQTQEYVLTWDLPRQQDAKDVYEGFNSQKGKTEIRYAKISKSINYKIGQLEGFIKAYSDILDSKQIDYINNEIEQLKSANEEEFEDVADIGDVPPELSEFLPSSERVNEYWNEVASAGHSHNMNDELKVLGYTTEEIKTFGEK